MILIATPTYGDRLLPACVESVQAQTIAHEHLILREQRYPPPDLRNVAEHYRHAWQHALAGDYTALLTLEHDMVLPDAEAVQRMVDTPGDIVFAPYVFRHGSHALNLTQRIGQPGKPGDSLTGLPDVLAQLDAQGYGSVGGLGWGCTLIRRHVLARVHLRVCSRDNAGDPEFAVDAMAAGFTLTARMDAACWHVEEGVWLHPTLGVRHGVSVRALRKFWCKLAGRHVRMCAGQLFETDRQMAATLAAKGLITILEDPNG